METNVSTFLCSRCCAMVPLSTELDRTRETGCLGACLPGRDLSDLLVTVLS